MMAPVIMWAPPPIWWNPTGFCAKAAGGSLYIMATPKIYTIPPGADFLKSLVRGLKSRLAPEALSRALILLPTHRAFQQLREAFLNEAGGGADMAMLLPDIRPLGEVEEEELMLSADGDFLKEVSAIPPAIDSMRRRMLLANLVLAAGFSKPQAFLLAADLAHLIDDALIEGCGFSELAALVPEKYAEHWQLIIKFLEIVSHNWPKILEDEKAIDAVDRRQRLTRLLIQHWQQNPPAHPVIAAGSTGSQPVTAEWLKCISMLPQGAVVLPGLDVHLEEEAWAELEPSHPQYLLSRLLKTLEAAREDVKAWPETADGTRAVLLSEVMRPSEAADRWRHLRPGEIPAQAWRGLEVIEATQEQEEAMAAALLLRKAVEEEGKMAALITPDRAMAKRVGALMRRWNIELDDSAGTPLSETPVGSYLNLLLEMPNGDLRPSQLMAFFKHPFTGAGLPREELLSHARHLEKEFFRKQPWGRGLKNWVNLFQKTSLTPAKAGVQTLDSGLRRNEGLEVLEKLSKNLESLTAKKDQPFPDWLKDFQKTAVSLAADENLLWREAEGAALGEFLESLQNGARDFVCSYADFAEIFRAALREKIVRRAWGQHPRLSILGLLEARLLRFDQVILAGLNEGAWPEERRVDPWMSTAMRVDLGCADPEIRLGQMAHDFVQQAAGPQVALLRSARAGETLTLPSRWLLRLEAVRALMGAEIPTAPYLSWARAMDFCEQLEPCDPPQVQVPAAALPKKINASDFEMWLRDPYAFYARRVLELRALNALDGEFGPRERGNVFHKALEKLAERYSNAWPPVAQQDFVRLVQDGFAAYGCSPEECKILSARLPELAQEYWFFEKKRRDLVSARYSEYQGALAMKVDNYSFSLEARADRIEVLKSGGLAILDYKTGSLPPEALREALRPQLYVEAVMAEAGGFPEAGKNPVAELAFVAFDQNKAKVSAKTLDLPPQAVEKIHRPGLENFIRAFLNKDGQFLAAPRAYAKWLDPAPDYARLARVAEWSKGALEQEEGDA
ncbi:MAG: double-strand break repair protein AddB [Proteobacteria bacterium]|nr:double-strand break repair protein AddB [Pseudomonadota bacterium]